MIRDAASFVEWRRQLDVPAPRTLPHVAFQLPGLSTEQNRTASALVMAYEQECGCTSGKLFMGAAVVVTAAAFILSGGRLADIGFRQALFLFGIVVVAAVFGKLVGLAWARWRLIRIARSLSDKVGS